MLSSYSEEAKEWLCDVFSGLTVPWTDIERFLIEHTMLQESQILTHVLRPLIEAGAVKKHDLCGKRNYKSDSYTFSAQGEHQS